MATGDFSRARSPGKPEDIQKAFDILQDEAVRFNEALQTVPGRQYDEYVVQMRGGYLAVVDMDGGPDVLRVRPTHAGNETFRFVQVDGAGREQPIPNAVEGGEVGVGVVNGNIHHVFWQAMDLLVLNRDESAAVQKWHRNHPHEVNTPLEDLSERRFRQMTGFEPEVEW